MKNFHRDSRSGGPRGGKGFQRHDFGDNRGSRPGMHQTICSECGRECEVPFRPTGDRPVFCSACFEKHGKADSKRSDAKNYQRSGFDRKRIFEAVCDKCGKKCEVPFRPTGDKPVYCSRCFEKGSSPSGKAPDQLKQQFEILNSKLDKILKVLAPAVPAQAPKEGNSKKETKKNKANKTSAKPVAKKVRAKKSAKGGSASGGKKIGLEKPGKLNQK